MRILALPRDPNPYQGLLYAELERLGVRVRYLGEPTRSRTLNLALLPLELAARRLAGWRVLHVHWVFGFALPGARRLPVLRRASQAWFGLFLATARALGVRIVWTAHNVLPHEPVFHDDAAARRALVRASDLVIAHSRAALAGLAGIGAAPRVSAVVPLAAPPAPAGVRVPGSGDGPRRVLFFGKLLAYKGVEELLLAAAALPDDAGVRVTVAGECPEPALRARLQALAAAAGDRVALRPGFVPDDELHGLLASADAVALPFRRVTTTSSAALALAHGRPLIVPDLPALAELPDGAVVRYDGSVAGLAAALESLAGAAPDHLAAMSRAARAHAAGPGWDEAAARTLDLICCGPAVAR